MKTNVFIQEFLKNRYLHEKGNNCTESESDLYFRVADFISEADFRFYDYSTKKIWRKKYFDLMLSKRFLPNSPTLMNAGSNKSQLSACFVLPVCFDLENFFSLLQNIASIHSYAGGTGFNFSACSPLKKFDLKNLSDILFINSISAIRLIDALTNELKIHGSRRGANMAVLNFSDPEINLFLESKSNTDHSNLSNFNLSVLMKDDELKSIYNHSMHPFHNDFSNSKDLTIWKKLIHSAHSSGDPGLLFFDAINRSNPLPALGEINATNPCGEVPLFPFESCNLGSMNLAKYVINKQIDWFNLHLDIHIAIRFLDNVIDMNDYILPEIEFITKSNRKIGLGVMGWAHMLILLEIPYASSKAVYLARRLMKFIHNTSIQASAFIAEEKGNFPNWKLSTYANRFKLRNATLNSIAPTGSISILANTSYSIEPLFSLAFSKFTEITKEPFSDFDLEFKKFFSKHNLWNISIEEHVKVNGSVQHLNLHEDVKKIFLTANEISPYWHLQHQKAFQDFTDNAVSKTINLPSSATETEIQNIFFQAWKMNLKGITIYRDKSNKNQTLQKGFCTSLLC